MNLNRYTKSIQLHILNITQKKVGDSIEGIGMRDNFLNRKLIPQKLNSTINKWNFLKMKSLCKAEDTINGTKWQTLSWEKVFINPTSHRGWISKIYKEL